MKSCGFVNINVLGTTWLDATTGWIYATGWTIGIIGYCRAGAIFNCDGGIFSILGLSVGTSF